MLFSMWVMTACNGPGTEPVEQPERLVAGAPEVGVAEGFLELPVGTPLGGYSTRCTCLGGGLFSVDGRDSPYTTSFIESAGVQTQPSISAIWLHNGDDHLVMLKTDLIYSDDPLLSAVEAVLTEQTGIDLAGKVSLATNHSHASYGAFASGVTWYLGTDRFDREIFDRATGQLAAVALTAHDALQPAKLGVGWTADWDPDNQIYSDRRGENDDLRIWGSDGPQLGKDPHLGVVRVDSAADEPLAMVVHFGMHGVVGGVDNPLVSTDAPGHVETALQEAFDVPVVVMFLQGAGADASPRGEQEGFARMESVGARATEPILALYDAIETSDAPITLESASRHVAKAPSDIHVTRGGTVDWRYAPYDPTRTPDGRVFDDAGALLSPIDEFNTPAGGLFCGTGDFPAPGPPMTVAYPYHQCVDASVLVTLVDTVFELPTTPLPLAESLVARTLVGRAGPLRTLHPDGAVVDADLLLGFFPGEPAYSYVEQWRRSAGAQLGFRYPMLVGYSQDHEGYMLLPEDWLAGGYEADITVWGPLEAEHVLERTLEAAEVLTTDVREPAVAPTPQPVAEQPPHGVVPDDTPAAGQRLTEAPKSMYTPLPIDLSNPTALSRVQGIVQLAWEGGDPMVDHPRVWLEREEGGEWEVVRTHSGRPVSSVHHDILLAHTPTPLGPADAPQTHQWWAAWQAVGHVHDRAGLPLGRYRLRVEGHRYAGQVATWPYDTTPYEVVGVPFDLVEAALTVQVDTAGPDPVLRAWIDAPVDGYRLVALGGSEQGRNPLVGPVDVTFDTPSGTVQLVAEVQTVDGASLVDAAVPEDWTEVRVVDAHGNGGLATRN